MISQDDFNLTDPKKKDLDWAKRMVQNFIYNGRRLTGNKNVRNLRLWQNTEYDLTPYKRPYLHLLPKSEGGELTEEEYKKVLRIDFTRLGLFELTKNILGGEIDKDKINIEADCFDPTIVADKEKEFDLLRNKNKIQAEADKLYKGIGIDSKYQVGNKGEFNSNITEFEGMGLNTENEEDINYFANTFYRHNLETYATQIINQLNTMNELSEIQKLHVNDIISLKCLALRTYYNTSTGLPTTQYVYPESVFFNGRNTRNDGKDNTAKWYTESMTISDFLKRIPTGESSKFTKEDYDFLLLYSGWGGSVGSTYPNGLNFANLSVCPEGCCTWEQYFQFNINVGYIEWKTTDKNELGRYQQKTMKSYYLANFSIPARLYDYGYLNVQVREGYESELSCFSIDTYRIEGLSMLETALPYFDRILSDWYRYQWFMESAKPKGYAYEINSLRRVAEQVLNGKGDWNDVISLIAMFKKSPDMFYSVGDEDSESKLGGSGLPYQEKVNGIDPSATKFLESIQFCIMRIMEETGMNNARLAQSPDPEEAYKKTQLVTNQSDNATEYVNSSIASIYGASGYRTFAIVQTIADLKLFGHEQLERIFGDKYMAAVKYMKKIPLQYYGITVRRFLREREREEIRAFTQNAVMKGELSEELGIIINNIDDYQKAASVLSYYKERTRKLAQQAEMQKIQAVAEADKARHQYKMEEINLAGQLELQKEDKRVEGLLKSTAMIVSGDIDKQTQRLQAQPLTNEQRSNLKKGEQTHNAGLKLTEKLVDKNDESASG